VFSKPITAPGHFARLRRIDGILFAWRSASFAGLVVCRARLTMEAHMAKGQKRSNREIKKPKKEKSVVSLAEPSSGKSSSATMSLFKKKV
jgi:hypothetical protein